MQTSSRKTRRDLPPDTSSLGTDGGVPVSDPNTASAGQRPTNKMRPTLPSERNLIGSSPVFRKAIAQAKKLGRGGSTVLILGETGTGKEHFARLIHEAHGAPGPFVAVNCASVSRDIASSEFFGHEKGSFTGAITNTQGFFKAATNGTLFLDEISHLNLQVQGALLRVLENGAVRKVGETREVVIPVRIVAATNRSLGELVQQQMFLFDLHWRLSRAVLKIPPLWARGHDVVSIAHHFLSNHPESDGRRRTFSRDATRLLLEHDWPGNVRELQGVLYQLLLNARGRQIQVPQLLQAFRDQYDMGLQAKALEAYGNQDPVQGTPDLERRLLSRLAETDGLGSSALCRSLRVSRSHLNRFIRKLIDAGAIRRSGAGRAARYHLIASVLEIPNRQFPVPPTAADQCPDPLARRTQPSAGLCVIGDVSPPALSAISGIALPANYEEMRSDRPVQLVTDDRQLRPDSTPSPRSSIGHIDFAPAVETDANAGASGPDFLETDIKSYLERSGLHGKRAAAIHHASQRRRPRP